MDSSQVKWTRVEFDGKAKNFPKYAIQLKAALGMNGWMKALNSEFERELLSTENEIIVETESSDKKKMEARSINAKSGKHDCVGSERCKNDQHDRNNKAEWPLDLAH